MAIKKKVAAATASANSRTSQSAWTATILLTLILGFLFLRQFIPLIMLATLLAYFTNPIYKKLYHKFGERSGLAASATTLILFLIVAVPFFIVAAIAVTQALVLVENLGLGKLLDEGNFEGNINSIVTEVNKLIETATGMRNAVQTDSIMGFVKSTLPDLVKAISNSLLAIVSSIPAFFMNLIIFLFVYIGILTNSKQLMETLHYLSPFDSEVNNLYFKRIGIMASAMLKGQFLIAFMQGLATAIGLAVVGLGDYFFFFLLIFTFMSLIPLGAGIITIPLGIVALLTGNIWQGLVILGNHFIIVTNIDNIRPKLVPVEARMQSALTILAAFAGVAIWGLLGVIYGPIIMIILVTTIEVYVNVRKNTLDKI